jgi:exonuclease III
MRNWSTDTTRLQKNSEQYTIWQLEQQLNYGLKEEERIDYTLLKKYLPELKIDEDTRNFLKFLLVEYAKKLAK